MVCQIIFLDKQDFPAIECRLAGNGTPIDSATDNKKVVYHSLRALAVGVRAPTP